MRFSPSSLLAVSLCASLAAQGTITDRNVSYSIVNVPTSRTSTLGAIDFSANGTDTSFQHWWYYCLDGDTGASALNSSGGQLVQSYAGNTATLKWANADGRGLSVVWAITLWPLSATSGWATSHIAFTNDTQAPIRLNVYGYIDADLHNTFGDDNVQGRMTFVGDFEHMLTDGGGGADRFVVVADRPDLDEVAAFPATRTKILAQGNGCPQLGPSFARANGTFGPGDYTGAFQWRSQLLNPGAILDVWMVLMHNHTFFNPCSPLPANSTTYCTATPGTHGVPRLSSSLLPVLPMSAALRVTNGLPNAAAVVNFGFSQACVNFLGLRVAMNPVDFGVPIALDASGVGGLVVPLASLLGHNICSTHVFSQCLFLDAGSSASVPVAATNGIDWTFNR